MILPSHSDASSQACAATRSLSHTLTGTRAVAGGTGTVSSGRPGAVSRMPPQSSRGVTSTRSGYSLAVTGAPALSTTIHRRSPASPQGSTRASLSRSPRQDLTGYRQMSVSWIGIPRWCHAAWVHASLK